MANPVGGEVQGGATALLPGHARLEVVHDSTVTHTRQLDKIEKTTDQLANKVKILELQNDLEQLDREWDNRRQTLLVRNKNGNVSAPSMAASILVGVIFLIVGIFVMRTQSPDGRFTAFPLFGLVIIGIAIFTMVSGTMKASTYREEQGAYESRRRALLERIGQQKNS